MLEVEGLRCAYDRIEVLHGVSLRVSPGEIVTLIGSNGAGKTTLLKALTGVHAPSAGTIRFDDRSMNGMRPERRVPLGLSLVPEGRQIFGPLSVEDNLRLGAYLRRDGEVARDLDDVYAAFPALSEMRSSTAGTLSGGQQQMLAIGRALMARPRLLLLDEPSMGLAPMLVDQIFAIIGDLRQRGITVLVVEQNAYAALALADRGYVMETGRITMEGSGRALLEDERVREAYLGI